MQTAVVHATALMRSFEHQLQLNLVGGGAGGRWGRICISTHICVGVFTAEEEERLHSFSRAAETSGWKVEAMEEDREERLLSQETQPQCSSFQASDFLIEYLRNIHLRRGTFAPDWKVCKHRSGVNPLRADLPCFPHPAMNKKGRPWHTNNVVLAVKPRPKRCVSSERARIKNRFNYKQSILASPFDLSSELLFKKKNITFLI